MGCRSVQTAKIWSIRWGSKAKLSSQGSRLLKRENTVRDKIGKECEVFKKRFLEGVNSW